MSRLPGPDLYPHHLDAREPEDVEEGEWTHFTRRTNEPKLAWLEDTLMGAGIPTRRAEKPSYHAPILQVPACDLDEAWSYLNEPDAEHGDVDDVPDDDPRYAPWKTK